MNFAGSHSPLRFKKLVSRAAAVCALALIGYGIFSTLAAQPASGNTNALVSMDPLVIDGENGTVIEGVRISSTSGDCISIRNSTDITIRNSVIGPCAGRGIEIEESSEVSIVGNRIQTQYKPPECCDKGSGILAFGSSNIVIDSNDIAYSETNIELMAVRDAKVTNNTLVNPLGPFPRGQQIQVASGHGLEESQDILIEGNTLIASQDIVYNFKENQEDAINLYFARDVTVRNNLITGGRSASGCGILVDDGANEARIITNRLYETGQCGIGIASGIDHLVEGNLVLLTREIVDAGNVAIYVWNQYEEPCGNVSVSQNVATFVRQDNEHNSFFDGGGCDPVNLSDNTFDDAAYQSLLTDFADVSDGMRPEFFPLEHPRESAGPVSHLSRDLIAVAVIGAAGSLVLFVISRRRSQKQGRERN